MLRKKKTLAKVIKEFDKGRQLEIMTKLNNELQVRKALEKHLHNIIKASVSTDTILLQIDHSTLNAALESIGFEQTVKTKKSMDAILGTYKIISE